MNPRNLTSALLCAILALGCGACSSSDDPTTPPDAGGEGSADSTPEPSGPQPYGAICESPEGCESGMCVDGYCSQLCKRLSDCPPVREAPDPAKAAGTAGGPCKEDGTCRKGLMCVSGECLRAFDCGRVDEHTLACYARVYDTRSHTTGHNCSMDGLCGQTYTCIGAPADADRYCSPTCEEDKQCPPEYRCARLTDYEGNTQRRCMRRRFGHPCDIDDQCAGTSKSELGCVKDANGKGYCSKTCTPTDSGTCPPYTKCEEAGNGRTMCKFKAGYGYTDGGKLCDPCIHHGDVDGKTAVEEGGCEQGGVCLMLSPYTGESSCLTPCGSGGTCPGDRKCFDVTIPSAASQLCAPWQPIPSQPNSITVAPCHGGAGQ